MKQRTFKLALPLLAVLLALTSVFSVFASGDVKVTPGSVAAESIPNDHTQVCHVNTCYQFYIDTDDVKYVKSVDRGSTWGSAVQVSHKESGVVKLYSFGLWWGGWTGNLAVEPLTGNAQYVYIAWMEENSLLTDTTYNKFAKLNILTDTLSGETVAGTGVGGTFGIETSYRTVITQAQGGDLFAAYFNEGSPRVKFYQSSNAGSSWTSKSITNLPGSLPVADVELMPGDFVDTNDIYAIWAHVNPNIVSFSQFDQSGNSWAVPTDRSVGSSGQYVLKISAFPRAKSLHYIVVGYVYDLGAGLTKAAVFNINQNIAVAEGTIFDNEPNHGTIDTFSLGRSAQGSYIACYTGSPTETTSVNCKTSINEGFSWGNAVRVDSANVGVSEISLPLECSLIYQSNCRLPSWFRSSRAIYVPTPSDLVIAATGDCGHWLVCTVNGWGWFDAFGHYFFSGITLLFMLLLLLWTKAPAPVTGMCGVILLLGYVSIGFIPAAMVVMGEILLGLLFISRLSKGDTGE